jgi:hypothetical protein
MARGCKPSVGLFAAALLAPPMLAAQGVAPNAAPAAETAPRVVPHTDDSIEVDGILDEALWRQALIIELDVEINPRENAPAPVETFLYVMENGSHLLVAFDAHDSEPDKIRAYLRDRDASWNDDWVGVFLDTFNDQRRAFEFFVNPLGVQMDATMDDVNGGESDAWDAIWESAGNIGDAGYTVEMAIPFSQLRFQRTADRQTWGFEGMRNYPRDDQVRLSSKPRDRGRNCFLCQFDKISGFATAEPGRGLEVVPSLTASRTDERDAATNKLVEGDGESEVGLNLRWAVTPDMIANIALNPDFSQIEADVPQLEVNNQFALFYPETRPFFLEGADFFSTPINAVFTRTVADPDFGAKLTGTSDKNTYGVFAAEDAVTNLLFPGPLRSSSDSLAQSNSTLVGRYQRGFGANSAVGAVVTTRSGDDYHNHVVGFDGLYRMNNQHSLSFQYLATDTQYPAKIVARGQPAGTFTGNATLLNYDYSTREWFAFANYRHFDPEFRADSGFVSRVDVENNAVGGGRTWHGNGLRWWNQLRLGGNTGSTHDTSGRLLNRWREAWFGLQGPRQLYSEMGLTKQQEFWNGQLYDKSGAWVYAQARPFGGLNFGLSLNTGDRIDYANSRLGEQLRVEPWLNWNANRHLLVGLQFTTERLDDQAGQRIYDAEVVDLRLTWQFSARSFLRLTQQQQRTERNLALWIDPNTDALSKTSAAQLLYSYQLNPQTVLYAGYSNEHFQNDDLAELTETGRTFFLKASYAWIP